MNNDNLPVCIIEDNKSIRQLFVILLKKSGCTTIDFADGLTSKEWLKENKTFGIVLDMFLPDANGFEILDYVRKLPDGNSIPIIAVTGFTRYGDKERFLVNGFDHYIPKPIDTSTFAEEILNIFETKNIIVKP